MDKEIQVMSFVNDKNNHDYEEVIINNKGKQIGKAGINKDKFKNKKVFAMIGITATLAASAFTASKVFSDVKLDPNPIISPIEHEKEVTEVEEKVTYVSTDYLVKNGDSLWSIVSSYANNNDINKIVSDIEYLNDLKGKNLQMNSVITLVGVPSNLAQEFNTGYNPNFEVNREEDELLVNKVEYILEISDGNEVLYQENNIKRELEMYLNSTNPVARKNLKSHINTLIDLQVKHNEGLLEEKNEEVRTR